MLDVHPPHHPTHTWKDFFIHIATIVVGLLIAIGLEQAVEYVHHRRELREIHEALAREHEDNIARFARNTDYLAQNVNALRNNLTVLMYLRAHPKATRAQLPGILIWPNLYGSMADIAWRSAQSSNITQLMSRDEVSDLADLYEALTYMNQVSDQSWDATTHALMYTFTDPDPTHFTSAQLDHEIELTQEALICKYRLGVAMGNIGKAFPSFSHAPSLAALQDLSVAAPLTPAQLEELHQATTITETRLAATPIP